MNSYTDIQAQAGRPRGVARLLRDARLRWASYVGAALVLAILVFVPARHAARATLLPPARAASAADLVAGQTQSFAMMFGEARASNDLAFVIARSDRVAADARQHASDPAADVDIHQLLGGAIEIVATRSDPGAAQRVVEAYVAAIGAALAPGGSVRLIDPPHLDPAPQFDRSALALLAAVVLLAVFVEFYAPATGLFRL